MAAIRDAISESTAKVAADINNNLNQKKSQQTASAASTSKGGKSTPANDLKQLVSSLTESIIVIEKDAFMGAPVSKPKIDPTNRTESNQSSSESLQDVEVDEGECNKKIFVLIYEGAHMNLCEIKFRIFFNFNNLKAFLDVLKIKKKI